MDGGDVFENISQIVDDSFNNYIVRQGSVEPLFAQFCDGVRTQCGGLSQWGSVDPVSYTHLRPVCLRKEADGGGPRRR